MYFMFLTMTMSTLIVSVVDVLRLSNAVTYTEGEKLSFPKIDVRSCYPLKNST
jgi:hypothetical protein